MPSGSSADSPAGLLAHGTDHRDVSYQATLVPGLGKVDLYPIRLYLDVSRDDLDQFVFEFLKCVGRDFETILNEDQLESLFGNLAAGWLFLSEYAIQKTHATSWKVVCCGR
jgi:hypothetical protein